MPYCVLVTGGSGAMLRCALHDVAGNGWFPVSYKVMILGELLLE